MENHNNESLEYVDCNLCGSGHTKKLMTLNGFDIVKCNKCSLVYVNPRLRKDYLHKIYNKKYFRNPAFKNFQSPLYGYHKYADEKDDIRATFDRRLRLIEKFSKKGNLLDIGCAYGFFLELAREYGWNVKGLELSEEAYRFAKNVLKLPVRGIPLEKAKFKSNFFNVVTIFDVIEHLPDPKAAMKEIRRVLKPNGLVVITTPDIGSLPARILGKNWEEVKRVREHIYFFSKDTLVKLLKSLDFEILKVESAGRYFSVKSAIERGKLHHKNIFTLLERFSDILNLNNKRIYVNPFYKMTFYARKI